MIQDIKSSLKLIGYRLSSAIELILLIMKLRFKQTQEEYDTLRLYLSPHIDEDNEHGWEELANASITHLLKTSLSKSGGGANPNAA
jgi:Bardet-Biedl syndrome 9 protein